MGPGPRFPLTTCRSLFNRVKMLETLAGPMLLNTLQTSHTLH